jgi:hypothetical protein
VLGLDEFLSFTLSLDEVEGDLDREILRWILIAAMIAVIVLIIAAAIVLAIVVVVVVAALTAELGATPAVAAAGMAFGLVTALAALLITIAETVGLSSIDTIVSALPWGARILRVSPTVSGLELASRLSPFRFHRVLHLADRPDAAALQPIVQVSELDDDGLRERYRGDALGGRYRVWLDVAT